MSFTVKYRSLFKLLIRIRGKQLYSPATCFSTLLKYTLPSITSTSFKPITSSYRLKTKGHKKKLDEADEEDSGTDIETEDFDSLVVDKNTKIVTVKVNSMRADVVLKSSLSIARNKIEEAFYESKIRVNGKKIFKKSDAVQEGDEIDIIKGVSLSNPKFLNIARAEILNVVPKKENFSIRVRRCRSLTIENYEDAWKPDV